MAANGAPRTNDKAARAMREKLVIRNALIITGSKQGLSSCSAQHMHHAEASPETRNLRHFSMVGTHSQGDFCRPCNREFAVGRNSKDAKMAALTKV